MIRVLSLVKTFFIASIMVKIDFLKVIFNEEFSNLLLLSIKTTLC